MLFSLGLKATFPGMASDVLPKVVAFPVMSLSVASGDNSYASLEMGALTMRTGEHYINLLTSTFYLGAYVRSYEVAIGYTVSSLGISALAIEDQGYMGLSVKGGYVRRLGRFVLKGGVIVSAYPMVASGRFSVIPVPLVYMNVGYGW
ncbi:MAG: hypothetical protein GXO29_07190 [Thermotogae bacterium]|nr:hypothetical protein [Thermotogota bacterium]